MPAHLALYPDIEPYAVDRIQVSRLHSLAYEQVGNPDGEPALFLHGGPGVGIFPAHRRFFDPSRFRVILLDQRGAGRSTPYAELAENTTWDIVEDLERLRCQLGITRWLVVGGSWGSTLALCYAIRHPHAVSGLVLRGVFLARPEDIDWVHRGKGASAVYPDAWDAFVTHLPQQLRSDPLTAYYLRLTSRDAEARAAAAIAWTRWQASIMSLTPDDKEIESLTVGERSISLARTECHFAMNGFFMPTSNYILENVDRIHHVPCRIVHGRYDIVCPARSAWCLHKAMPGSQLDLIQNGAHSPTEGDMTGAMIKAIHAFAP